MIPKRPFLLRAFYDWIVESNMTPHIVVNTELDEVTVPKQHIKDGKIVLNISPMAVQDFIMDNEALSFSARFSGVSFYIYCPMYAIEAIYARESPAEGVSFSPDEYADVTTTAEKRDDPAPVAVLSAVSGGEEEQQGAEAGAEAKTEAEIESEPPDDDETPPPRKRPSLRVVK